MNSDTCNNCQYCLKVLAPSKPPTWNIKCSHPIGDIAVPSGRIIKFRSDAHENIERPSWCPLVIKEMREKAAKENAQKANEPETYSNGKPKPKRWNKGKKPDTWDIEVALRKIKPVITLDDIQEGDVIHFPPTPNEPRMDVLIKHKYVYSASGPVIGDENRTAYIYSSGLKSAIMSKRKKDHFNV